MRQTLALIIQLHLNMLVFIISLPTYQQKAYGSLQYGIFDIKEKA